MAAVDNIVTIPEFYRGKSVFVTGATGFIGKVLIEKLLRSCPDIGYIYILLRPKRNATLEDRMKKITDIILFDKVKELYPENIKKLKFVAGDVSEINLGLSSADYNLLVKNVDVIFHIAATIKFQAPLSDSVLINTRGTREICNLALAIKRKPILVHVSTSYCHHENRCIKEEIYEPYGDWRKTIKIAESMDRHILNVITAKIKGIKENTYIFTKSLAEQVVQDLCVGKIPTIILRPAIVVGVLEDPLPGYCEGFSGHIGILVGALSGLMRCINLKKSYRSESVPVDFIAKGLINSVWLKGTGQSEQPVSIYNGSSNNLMDWNNETFANATNSAFMKIRTTYRWYPHFHLIETDLFFYLYFMIFQLLPCIVADFIICLKKGQPILITIQRKIFTGLCVLEYFKSNEWKIENKNFLFAVSDAPTNHEFIIDPQVHEHNFIEKNIIKHLNFINKHYLKQEFTEHLTSPTKFAILKTIYYIVHTIVYSTIGYVLYSVLY
ncbi:PREDICTED: putative fatty acyl-CoA reductase CG5065 [Nicrophorus vespilloides]|uniref:Fatty acyl-CoA reductase n=1 Tax=Nicrophorus vespilloides TaxID=110193 RepID=A0ABM1N1C3_NICVS|nr:PREDICTED: putative fatty acyl-CoA reductase CG5065 [Nicrophorus vespilloides]